MTPECSLLCSQQPILSYINLLHTLKYFSLRSILILSFHLCLRLPNCLFLSVFPNNLALMSLYPYAEMMCQNSMIPFHFGGLHLNIDVRYFISYVNVTERRNSVLHHVKLILFLMFFTWNEVTKASYRSLIFCLLI